MNFTQRPKSRRSANYSEAVKNAPAESAGAEQERPGKKPKAKKQQPEDDDAKPRKKRESLPKRILHGIFPQKGDAPSEAVRKVVFDIAVIALIVTGGSVLYDLVDEGVHIVVTEKELQDTYINGSLNLDDAKKDEIRKERPEMLEKFMGLYAENSDIVGWIQLSDIINYPVVQHEDNDYYLDHDFNKKVTKSGAIFADYRNRFDPGELSGNTVLYGHNVWSGSMFARLSRYYDARLHNEYTDRLGFYKEHPTITFDTLYEESEWKVFACVLFNTRSDHGEVYPYTQTHDFVNKDAFNSFIMELMDRSILWTDVDLTYGDNILTLSTCYQYSPYTANDDVRCAVFARKVREGESPEVDVSKARINPDPLRFSYQYQIKAEGSSEWGGGRWDASKLLSYSKYE